jgi:penicillin-binding protein 2
VLPEPLGFSDDALTHVRAGMNAAVNVPGGTAYVMRITQPGFEMAGKTGTAQVRRITAADRASGRTGNAGLPWNLREHALFISFAPVSAPRYACSVIVEHGAAALEPQAGVARDILLYAQQRGVLNLPTDYPVQAASLERAGGK